MHQGRVKRLMTGAVCSILLWTSVSFATDPIPNGRVMELSHRDGYVMFKVVAGSVNACQPCPGDPAGFSGGEYCWIADTEKAKLTTLYLARALDEVISGRVTSLASNCAMYQLTLRN